MTLISLSILLTYLLIKSLCTHDLLSCNYLVSITSSEGIEILDFLVLSLQAFVLSGIFFFFHRKCHADIKWAEYKRKFLKDGRSDSAKWDRGSTENTALHSTMSSPQDAAEGYGDKLVTDELALLTNIKKEPTENTENFGYCDDQYMVAGEEGERIYTNDLSQLSTVACNLCGKVMLKTDNVSRHFRLKHPDEKPQTSPRRTTFHR